MVAADVYSWPAATLARCADCDAERNERLVAELARADTINCDFCGTAYTDYDLHPVVIPFAAVLIRAVGCTECLGDRGD